MMKNYYDQLGIEHNASMEEIKQAYRRLAKKYHPDVNHGNPNAEVQFKKVKEAYETLYSTELREKYDARLGLSKQRFKKTTNQSNDAGVNSQGFNPANVQQTFEQFFGFDPKTKKRNVNKSEKQKSKNPLDTSDFFNSYFGRK